MFPGTRSTVSPIYRQGLDAPESVEGLRLRIDRRSEDRCDEACVDRDTMVEASAG